jgi:hypothetical protein
MYNASQRNSLKEGFIPVDPNPNQQHYQNNRGPGVFIPTSPLRSMSGSRHNSPSLKSSRIVSLKREEEEVIDPKKLKFKYKKRGP